MNMLSKSNMSNEVHIAIRADASEKIGSGHIIRCLALANELKCRGAQITFVSRLLPGHLGDWIEQQGFSFCLLPSVESEMDGEQYFSWLKNHWDKDLEQSQRCIKKSPDWWIVDHYGLDCRWEKAAGGNTTGILAVDDTADRLHYADFLLDQNLQTDELQYSGLNKKQGKILGGSPYILLRKAFTEARQGAKIRNGDMKKILVFFGGGDAQNHTSKALAALERIEWPSHEVHVVVGSSNPHKEAVKERCVLNQYHFYCQIENMQELMVQADVSIGACGTAAWERFCLGLPSIVVSAADNQLEGARLMYEQGYLLFLGEASEVTSEHYYKVLKKMQNNPGELREMSARIFSLIDGKGTGRVADILYQAIDKERGRRN